MITMNVYWKKRRTETPALSVDAVPRLPTRRTISTTMPTIAASWISVITMPMPISNM